MKLEWKKISEEPIRMHYRKLLRRWFRLPDNHEYEFILKDDGPVVSILPLTPEGKILTVQQFRPGPERLFYELPGGLMDPYELPMDAAVRELREETGYAGEMEAIGVSYPDGYSTLKQHLFIARNCMRVGDQQLDPTEFLEVHLFTPEEFMQICLNGQTTDGELFFRYLATEKQ